ncbi:hypothetical protein HAX54_050301 [Datura stramonium]|uniref:Uncharacterized protein n=1 Tax=Datura stramonium TaxID=4076 RepID=A0ABS8WQ60_DATST|nr:hypothetical protein [Datura stramonium]
MEMITGTGSVGHATRLSSSEDPSYLGIHVLEKPVLAIIFSHQVMNMPTNGDFYRVWNQNECFFAKTKGWAANKSKNSNGNGAGEKQVGGPMQDNWDFTRLRNWF